MPNKSCETAPKTTSDQTSASLPPQSDKQSNLGISEVDLAFLTAGLAAAKLISFPPNHCDCEGATPATHVHLITSAIEFFKTCQEIHGVMSDLNLLDRQLIKRRQKISAQYLALVKMRDQTPIAKVLILAGVERIRLTPDELKKFNIKTSWNKLSPKEKSEAIYLCLTDGIYLANCKYLPIFDFYNSVEYLKVFGDLEQRKKYAQNGLPTTIDDETGEGPPIVAIIDALKKAHKMRKNAIQVRASQASKKSGRAKDEQQ
jgi:hypothetical protein